MLQTGEVSRNLAGLAKLFTLSIYLFNFKN